MKRILLTLFVVGLLLSWVCPTYAHRGDRSYPFFELTDQDLAAIDVHDGSIAEWFDLLGDPTLTALDLHASNFYDPADFDFRIWLAWHDATNRIYVAMEQADDIYFNEYDQTNKSQTHFGSYAYLYDSSIILHLDADHSGGSAGANTFGGIDAEGALDFAGQSQSFTGIGSADGGPHVSNFFLQSGPRKFGDWYTLPPYAEGGGVHFGENPTISVTEFYVTPFDWMIWDNEQESTVSDLYPGKVIGISITVTDWDASSDNDSGNWFTIPGVASSFSLRTDNFADGVLLSPGGTLPEEEDTAVENDSWARIKAGFRR